MQIDLPLIDWTPIYKAPVFDPRNPEIRQKLLALLGTGKDGEWFDVCPIYVFGDQGTVYRNHGAFGIWSSDFGTLLHFMAENGKRGGDDDALLPADQQDKEVAQAMQAIAKAKGEKV